MHDGEVSGHHVDDAGWNEERRDLSRRVLAFQEREMVFLDPLDSANPGSDRHPNALSIVGRYFQAGVLNRLLRRCYTVLDERIHTAGILARHVTRWIEVSDLPPNPGRKFGKVEVNIQWPDATRPGHNGRPSRRGIQPQRGHHTQASHNNAALIHAEPVSISSQKTVTGRVTAFCGLRKDGIRINRPDGP